MRIKELQIQHLHLLGITTCNAITKHVSLDTHTDPRYLNYSKLSKFSEWEIEAKFEGGLFAVIVTCNWSDVEFYIAHTELHFWPDTREQISSKTCIIPFVKSWLTRLWSRGELYGVVRDCEAMDCPHLEIYGAST